MSTSVTMASSSDCRSQRVESSSASRALRRQERGGSSVRVHAVAYPIDKETGLPLIQCPDCHLARVIELRVKQDTPNKGQSFFKCPRNGVSFAMSPSLLLSLFKI